MRNKMKFWRRMAAAVKKAVVNTGMHIKGARYGRGIRVTPHAPVWRGGPPSMPVLSPLLSGMLKRQASL